MTEYSLKLPSFKNRQVVHLSIGDAPPKRGNRFTQALARSTLALFGWRIEGEFPNLPKMILVGAPHTSNWDMVLGMVVIWALGLEMFWTAKKSLFRWPHGGFMRWLGGVPVNREVSEGLVGQTVAEYNRRDKFLLTVLPSGTRARGAQWKTGFYHIATGAGTPILPVKFDYGRKVLSFGSLFHPTGDVVADVAKLHAHFVGTQGKNWRQE